jgi:hypothetical protein
VKELHSELPKNLLWPTQSSKKRKSKTKSSHSNSFQTSFCLATVFRLTVNFSSISWNCLDVVRRLLTMNAWCFTSLLSLDDKRNGLSTWAICINCHLWRVGLYFNPKNILSKIFLGHRCQVSEHYHPNNHPKRMGQGWTSVAARSPGVQRLLRSVSTHKCMPCNPPLEGGSSNY